MANKSSLLWLALFPALVLAQQPAPVQQQPAAQPNYLDEMAKIDAQIAYIQKQTELKTVLQKSAGNEGLPRILSILVDSRGGSAQVVYGSGIVRWLKVGDVLTDGLRVRSISKSTVLVGGREGRFPLAFVAPQAAGAPAAAPSGPLPPLPNINIPMPLPPAVSPPPGAVPAVPAQTAPQAAAK